MLLVDRFGWTDLRATRHGPEGVASSRSTPLSGRNRAQFVASTMSDARPPQGEPAERAIADVPREPGDLEPSAVPIEFSDRYSPRGQPEPNCSIARSSMVCGIG